MVIREHRNPMKSIVCEKAMTKGPFKHGYPKEKFTDKGE
jgi:hypothetical protein